MYVKYLHFENNKFVMPKKVPNMHSYITCSVDCCTILILVSKNCHLWTINNI